MWPKGFTEMLDMLSQHKRSTGKALPIDAFGSGADFEEVISAIALCDDLKWGLTGIACHLSPGEWPARRLAFDAAPKGVAFDSHELEQVMVQ